MSTWLPWICYNSSYLLLGESTVHHSTVEEMKKVSLHEDSFDRKHNPWPKVLNPRGHRLVLIPNKMIFMRGFSSTLSSIRHLESRTIPMHLCNVQMVRKAATRKSPRHIISVTICRNEYPREMAAAKPSYMSNSGCRRSRRFHLKQKA